MALTAEQAAAYLARINTTRPARPDRAGLDLLQGAHLRSVPFENLDIHRGVRIRLDLGAVYDKVVMRGRGGYCYELNALFAALLDALGYRVTMVSARVARPDGTLGPEFDHLALLVDTDAEPVLVDVGFGDAFDAPLPMLAGVEHEFAHKKARLRQHDNDWAYEEDSGGGWATQYAFSVQPRSLDEFEAMNDWQQSSYESHFTRSTVCSLATHDGRVTLSGHLFIERHGHLRTEREVPEERVDDILWTYFAIHDDRF